MQTLAEIIGRNIKTRREALGLSQTKLGRRLGMHNNTVVCYWETGRCCPGAHYLWELSRVFGCAVDDLCEGVERNAE